MDDQAGHAQDQKSWVVMEIPTEAPMLIAITLGGSSDPLFFIFLQILANELHA